MSFDSKEFKIKPLIDASKTLKESVLKKPLNDLERDGVIQRFEYTFELSWKTLKKYLELYSGITESNIKNIFREAGNQRLISDVEIWFGYLKSRNETSHLYNSQTAELVYKEAVKFSEDVNKLVKILEKLIV